jgi:hypothetical protein
MTIKEISFEDKIDKQVLQLCKNEKLSVSGVKYHRGHDGNGLTCNLKLKNKIVGTLLDDGWGGGFMINDKSQAISVTPFNKAIQRIMKKAPKYNSKSLDIKDMSYSYDMVVDVLIKAFEIRKDCKKKILIKATKCNSENAVIDTYTFNTPYDDSEKQTKQIALIMQEKGYVKFEIVNKRLK